MIPYEISLNMEHVGVVRHVVQHLNKNRKKYNLIGLVGDGDVIEVVDNHTLKVSFQGLRLLIAIVVSWGDTATRYKSTAQYLIDNVYLCIIDGEI